ncbi:MAG: FAD-dependent oxidoreductase [Chloroflexi bacterium]|nr:MAG: FAD-dependent oxidoreductase [Chloroflexota bacterium]
MKEFRTDILIAGGGLGGVAAALAALKLGRRVILTEETDWIGGQMTAQAVPPDENPWIESVGGTNSYQRLREGIRAYYRQHYPLTKEAREIVHLNPGNGNVSALCHEPRVALAVLEAMLQPYRSGRQLLVLLKHCPVSAVAEGDFIRAVTFRDEESGEEVTIQAEIVLDATELGDLLELAGVEYVTGAESREQTGEPHALPGEADPYDQQAVTWCFAMDHIEGADFTIPRPPRYDFWRKMQLDFWPGPQLGWEDYDPETLEVRHRSIYASRKTPSGRDPGTFWLYRRIFNKDYYSSGLYLSDITLVNWPQNDYWLGPLIGVPEKEKAQHLQGAKELSLALLYWMQTEAPRPEGGYGYPGLRLRGDVAGGEDGLAKSVYIRESRRIQAQFTVLEQHVGVLARKGQTSAEVFHDSVGIGSYRIDLHPSTGKRNYVDISCYPFQIPLGALIPVRVRNLLPACKNLGVTHITNGCYRLHPVEWNIGEAAGALAAYCLNEKLEPAQVRVTPNRLADFQALLGKIGIRLAWPDYARITTR